MRIGWIPGAAEAGRCHMNVHEQHLHPFCMTRTVIRLTWVPQQARAVRLQGRAKWPPIQLLRGKTGRGLRAHLHTSHAPPRLSLVSTLAKGWSGGSQQPPTRHAETRPLLPVSGLPFTALLRHPLPGVECWVILLLGPQLSKPPVCPSARLCSLPAELLDRCTEPASGLLCGFWLGYHPASSCPNCCCCKLCCWRALKFDHAADGAS